MPNQYQVKGQVGLIQCASFQEAWGYYAEKKENLYKISFVPFGWEEVSHTWHRWMWFTKKEFLEWMAQDNNVDYSAEKIQKAFELCPRFAQIDDDDEKVVFWLDMPMTMDDRWHNKLNAIHEGNLSRDEKRKAGHRLHSLIWTLYNVLTESDFKNLYWNCN